MLLDQQAAKVPVGANKLLYLPYLMGERTPHLDANARGVFFGLSAIHTRADMLRAVMEGVTFSLKDCLSVFEEMNLRVKDMLACGGGGSSSLWRQMLADVYGCNVRAAISKEGPALGAALLAGVGTGIYKSVPEACEAVIKTNPPQSPDIEASKKYAEYYCLYKQLYPALKDNFNILASIN